MTSTPRRISSRPVIAATLITLIAVAVAQVPATSQSPSVPPSSAPGVSAEPGASAAAAPSAVPVDVAAIEWTQSKKSKGFDARGFGGPMAFDLAVGSGGRFLLAGVLNEGGFPDKAVVWGSDDGVRWTTLKGSVPRGSQAQAVLATEAGFLVAGDVNREAALLRTSDGKRLSKLDAPADGLPSGALYGLDRSPMGLLAAGEDADHRPTIWLSTDDGATWTGTAIPEAFYVIHLAVTDTGVMVALGNQQDAAGDRTPTAWSSSDGVTWAPSPFPVDPGAWSVPDLERTPVGLVATLAEGGVGGSAWLSLDGATWAQVLETPSRLTVGTAGAEAILFGGDAWWHSADGVTWTESAASAFRDLSIETSAVRADGAVIAAGYQDLGAEGSSVRTFLGVAP